MAMDADVTDQAITAVADAYALPDAYERCMSFMLAALGLIDELPEMAAGALAQARSYWKDQNKDVSLEAQKEVLWGHLDRMARTGANHGREEAILRDVLFVLDAKPATDDLFELLDWFFQYVCRAGPRCTEIVALLQEHLPVGDGPETPGR